VPADRSQIFSLNHFSEHYRMRRGGEHGQYVPNARFTFVKLTSGETLLHQRLRHPVLAEGRPVLYAGEMNFNNGRLEWWSNGSGNYRPDADHAAQAGLPMDHFFTHDQVLKGLHTQPKVEIRGRERNATAGGPAGVQAKREGSVTQMRRDLPTFGAAPGAFRPALQTSRGGNAPAGVSGLGGAPPVYRPQTAPGPLQAKRMGAYRPDAMSIVPAQRAAPPVYRPEVRPAMQLKPVPLAVSTSNAPPVYRPFQQSLVQPKPVPAVYFPRPAGAPAVYRPQRNGVSVPLGSGALVRQVVQQAKPPNGQPMIARPQVPFRGACIQRVKYIWRKGQILAVPDEYKKKKSEKNKTEEEFLQFAEGPTAGKAAVEEARKLREQQAAKALALRLEEERRAARRERRERLAKYPKTATRRDRNFANQQNSRGQGKAYLVDTGLAAAGATEFSPMDQLVQDSVGKGSSNLVSLSGPNPTGDTGYGGGGAEMITVKLRKLMRAKEKGKADASHLEVLTSGDLVTLASTHRDRGRLTAFVRKDDEHQVRVRTTPSGSGVPTPVGVIGSRFLVLPDGTQEHDSDSESEVD
jgi:hypothetical protein